MDEKFKQKWDYTIRKAALEAMKSKDKMYNEISGRTFTEDQREQTFRTYKERLAKEYPMDRVNDADLAAISSFQPDSMRTWLDQYGSHSNVMSPTAAAKAAKAADILPLLNGYAKEGESWYDIPSDYLKENGAKLGYNVRTKEGFKQFLDDIGEQQINFDRAKLVQEAKEQTPFYTVRKMITPSAFQEFENAIATGGDYDESDAVKYGILDGAMNTLIFEAPNITATRSPIASTILNAAVQAGGEAGRQEGKVLMSDNGQTFDPTPVWFAPVSGATRPGTVGVVQNTAAKIPGPAANNFARGFSRATRAGDPVDIERNNLKTLLNNYNKFTDKEKNLRKEYGAKAIVESLLEDVKFASEKPRVADIKKLFKLRGNNKLPGNNKVNVDKALKSYDAPYYGYIKDNGLISADYVPVNLSAEDLKGYKVFTEDSVKKLRNRNKNNGARVLDSKDLDEFKRLFPQRFNELDQGTGGAFNAGMRLGQGVNKLFGSAEPTFKIGIGLIEKDSEAYKEQDWYKNMKPTARKIIDEAFKEKSKDDEE